MSPRDGHRLRAAAALLGALAVAGCAPVGPAAPAEGYTVAYVLDGDTIAVTGPDGEERVRLLGIDAPEISHEGEPGECGGEEAAAQLEELLPEGAAVHLATDSRADDADRYGRLLRYVELEDGTDAGHALITHGRVIPWAPSSEPTPDRLPAYEDAADEARESRAGSWATCDTMDATR